MSWSEYKYHVQSDLYRYCGRKDVASFLKCYLSIPGFKYTFLMRSARFLKSCGLAFWPCYAVARVLLNHYQFKFGISIPYNTDVGPGLYIGHYGGIFVNYSAKIGRNCNINQEVTVGATYGGKYPGSPTIMDNVYLGPGSKIIGGIQLGSHVAVGANCVVTKPVPENGVVVGIPGEVVSLKGSGEYVVNTVDARHVQIGD
jgi:serine O-acetyltransferase